MSARIVIESVNKPPAPTPWNARQAARSNIDAENAAPTEPAIKIPIAVMNKRRRPKMSPSFPYIGVVMVEVIRYAVVAQA